MSSSRKKNGWTGSAPVSFLRASFVPRSVLHTRGWPPYASVSPVQLTWRGWPTSRADGKPEDNEALRSSGAAEMERPFIAVTGGAGGVGKKKAS
ncbi:hypothetical protein PAHAL_8G190300 [Panicum hallii]|uniref:Uncharacterized protein n=1 Tax=Panicum hallii TaxID=206008 RepID=A0A2T8I9F7_9POAL|nr:hypothetical protein PAHAL_8G190300 [Panicum hallii]PVH34305.1 hypothetical protein PAHAL_8G190300 [Panicum hallii]